MAIRQLRTRTLADKFANDVRASRRKYGRYVYMGLVLLVVVYLGSMFAGPYIWLDAGGLITADRVIIGPSTDAQVTTIYVAPGQRVKKGDLLGEVHSATIAQNIADLKTRYADAASKVAELNIRLNVANTVQPVAQSRLQLAKENFAKLVTNKGYVSDLTYEASMAQLYDAELQVVTQRAQREGAADQLHNLNNILDEAQRAIADIQERYNNGRIYAIDDGIIGSQIAQRGDMLRAGDQFFELYVGRPYVLAYLETGTFYRVEEGDPVHVTAGFRTAEGHVTEVLPLAVQLPPEFQKTFRPRGRGQVARIELTGDDFPLATKVMVTSDHYIPKSWQQKLDDLLHGAIKAMQWVTLPTLG